jgi:hypothetical protein
MSFFDKIFSRDTLPKWTPAYRAHIDDLSCEEISSSLGKGKKTKDGFTFWTGRMSDLDPDYPEDEYFQLSNFDWRFGKDQKPRASGRNQWCLYASSRRSIRQVVGEAGGIARNIEEI